MMSTEPVSFTNESLNAVMNQLALIVSYSNLVIGQLDESDPKRGDLIEIRGFAFRAASHLGRPFRGSEHGLSETDAT